MLLLPAPNIQSRLSLPIDKTLPSGTIDTAHPEPAVLSEEKSSLLLPVADTFAQKNISLGKAESSRQDEGQRLLVVADNLRQETRSASLFSTLASFFNGTRRSSGADPVIATKIAASVVIPAEDGTQEQVRRRPPASAGATKSAGSQTKAAVTDTAAIPAPDTSSAERSAVDTRALTGLFVQRSVSIIVYVISSIAYPYIVVPAVGWAGYGALMALGPLAAIAAGPLNGALVDRLSPRASMTINTLVRGGLSLLLPVMAHFGVLNFWTLLAASFANAWALSSTMITEGAYIKRLIGPKDLPRLLGPINGLLWIDYLGLQVLLGGILGVGTIVDKWNPLLAFLLSAAGNLLIALPVIWFTMPKNSSSKTTSSAPKPLLGGMETAKSFLRANALPASLLAVAALLYSFSSPLIALLQTFVSLPGPAAAFLRSTVLITAALVYWICRTNDFKSLWRGEGREISPEEARQEEALRKAREEGRLEDAKRLDEAARPMRLRLRSAVLYLALSAFMLYPLQAFLLPLIAETLVGSAAKGLLLGHFLGAFFLGNLISNAAQARLPSLRIPFLGRELRGERIVQAVVLAMTAAWVYTGLLPGSLAAAALAAFVAAGLMRLSSVLSDRGWVKFFGLGFCAVWLPYAVWSAKIIPLLPVPSAVMLSMLLIGMFYGPGFVSLNSYFQKNARQDSIGKVVGIQGSFTNAAVSAGFGIMSMLAAGLTQVLPPLLAIYGAFILFAAWVFWRAGKRLPGLPDTLLRK